MGAHFSHRLALLALLNRHPAGVFTDPACHLGGGWEGRFGPDPAIYQTTGLTLNPKEVFGAPGKFIKYIVKFYLRVTDNATGHVKCQIFTHHCWLCQAK